MLPISALALGIAGHQAVRRREIDSKQVQILLILVACHVAVTLLLWDSERLPKGLFVATTAAIKVDLGFLIGLFSSIGLYRVFFHRCRHFPGPLGARLSKFWALIQAAETVQWNEKVRELHSVYGDFVRIGPREISINRPSAIQALYGPPSVLKKAPWYAQLSNDPDKCSVNATRDVEDHRRRRRAWDRGLGSKGESQT